MSESRQRPELVQGLGASREAIVPEKRDVTALKFESPAAERLHRSLELFGGYWRDYDFNDPDDLPGLRETLKDLMLEAHAAITELGAARGW